MLILALHLDQQEEGDSIFTAPKKLFLMCFAKWEKNTLSLG
jgi:hypothetical protein